MSERTENAMNIYDISKKAGVSIATVSRVLNDSAKVSAATRQRVLDVIRETNYMPNAFARSLGLNSMYTVGLLCSGAGAAKSFLHLHAVLYRRPP